MIAGTLYASSLSCGHPVLYEALEWLKQALQDGALPEGRTEMDGDRLYVNIMEFQTKASEEQPAEKHEKYIDIHYLIEGYEMIGWSPIHPEDVPAKPYDAEEDYALYEPRENECLLPMKPGMFAVFFPSDIHRPGLGGQTMVKKAVIKIHTDLLR